MFLYSLVVLTIHTSTQDTFALAKRKNAIKVLLLNEDAEGVIGAASSEAQLLELFRRLEQGLKEFQATVLHGLELAAGPDGHQIAEEVDGNVRRCLHIVAYL